MKGEIIFLFGLYIVAEIKLTEMSHDQTIKTHTEEQDSLSPAKQPEKSAIITHNINGLLQDS